MTKVAINGFGRIGRLAFRQMFEAEGYEVVAINYDVVLTSLYSVLVLTELATETTLSGVILQQVGQHLRAGQVVDCYYFITFSLKHLTECEATDTAKAVNCYFCHCFTLN